MKFNIRTKAIAKAICVLAVGITLLTKILQVSEVLSQMEAIGLQEMLPLLIGLEATALILYIFPRTARVGFFLLVAYYGGAIAVNLHQPSQAVPAIVFMVIIWVTTFIQMPEIFGYSESLTN
ncbi:hypothetical protein SAMN00777080_3479 [Aquiflexum balticum DSM 16537]|uniref:DoxX-like family protein n=1 Tax=Aquiflexum balticum DSM 16537 TaxID=758820 RepID=A0A1W2H7F4_9BACT|nr:hypothetical protein [Aquiflexum balticum]SMD44843.1 hypothetical protein SAMN00777080_3479 [Aquiflexum balticum DSM 16537]